MQNLINISYHALESKFDIYRCIGGGENRKNWFLKFFSE